MTVLPTSRHLTASMVVIDPRTNLLLLVHHKASGLWMFPGGHVDPDEAPHEAARREVHEEAGVLARHVHPGGAYPVRLPLWMYPQPAPMLVAEIPAPAKPERPHGKPAEPEHSHIDLLYVGTADSSLRLDPALAEVSAARWVPLADLGGLQVREEVPAVVRYARARYFEESR